LGNVLGTNAAPPCTNGSVPAGTPAGMSTGPHLDVRVEGDAAWQIDGDDGGRGDVEIDLLPERAPCSLRRQPGASGAADVDTCRARRWRQLQRARRRVVGEPFAVARSEDRATSSEDESSAD